MADASILRADQSVPPAEAATAKSRSGSEQRQAVIIKPIRLTGSELADIEAQAKAAGMAVEEYMRDTAARSPEERGSDDHTTRRAHVKYLRMTPARRDVIQELADRAGLSFGSYVRARACKRPVTLTTRRPPVEKLELARLLGLLGNATSNLNQVARQLNSGGDVPSEEIEAAIALNATAAAAIIGVLGRSPRLRNVR